MIHILNAPAAICKYCPEDVSKFCHVFQGPLGGFLLLSVVLNVPAALCALSANSDSQVQNCTAASVATLCKVDLFLAAVHLVFPVYMKLKIERDEASGLEAPLDTGAPKQTRFRKIRDGVRNLALYDLFTCIYMFVFVFSAVWNVMGSTWIQSCLLTSLAPTSMVSLELVFFFLSIVYVACAVCFVNCADCYEGVQNSRTTNDVLGLVRNFRPIMAVVETICGPSRTRQGPGRRGQAGQAAPPEAQVVMGAPIAPSAPVASFAVPSAPLASTTGSLPAAYVTAATQALDTRQAKSVASEALA